MLYYKADELEKKVKEVRDELREHEKKAESPELKGYYKYALQNTYALLSFFDLLKTRNF